MLQYSRHVVHPYPGLAPDQAFSTLAGAVIHNTQTPVV